MVQRYRVCKQMVSSKEPPHLPGHPSSSLIIPPACSDMIVLVQISRGLFPPFMICPFALRPITMRMQQVYARNALHRQHMHLAAVRRSQPCARRLFAKNSMIVTIHWHMNNMRILASIRCIFNDKITRHDDAKQGSYLKTPKVKKLIFRKWRQLTGLDLDVDCDSIDVVYDPVNESSSLVWYGTTTEYDKWIDEITELHDYSSYTTLKNTERAAEPWLSMRNARIITQSTDTDKCSMGWSAGNMSLNLLTRLSTRNEYTTNAG